ncbi:ribosome hibernation factor-recruiting GTPase MRF [Modestobacter roseus]|uniref:G3E family GTPase n=1 Tax=Modestobacter roseus TaxID=1181884 RepID=A0A562IQA0_9ACTN|nr:GTP-binding protein [Modestobacter roseus]MQA34696.1 cobalamin biosynthesis protein CobW [Modestobacter roseus]TWH73171.1 G3E family GTPase [Modestobacter roseus]
MTAPRTSLVLVTGLSRELTARAATPLLDRPGTVVVHHDVSGLDGGVVVRTLREAGPHGVTEHVAAIELAHGCLSCTLRLDLLPLLRTLGRRPDVSRVVLELDPALEPEHLCWSIENVVLDDLPDDGGTETAGDSVQVTGVLAALDAGSWFDAATGEEAMADVGLAATADDERTLAQVAIGQVESADAVLVAGQPADAWSGARLTAVLDRLLPGVPRARLGAVHPDALLTALPRDARRGRVSSPHDPLLAGQPPLDEDAGVGLVRFAADRPFHPERLHDALDVLLDGVVRTRGRLWLATQHDRAVWLESAGGGLRVGDAGPWLDTLGDDAELWAQVDPQRAAAAALRWDPVFGDRDVQLVVLTHRQSPMAITTTLFAALLTDAELAAGPDLWATWPDPFGEWHEDPCEASTPTDLHVTDREEHP